MRRPARRGAAGFLTVASAGLLLGVAAPPAAAGSDRMMLACQDGRVIERSNGSNWWGVDSEVGYVTERLLIISQEGELVYEKDYGRKAPDAERSRCVAEHFGSTWNVELVRTR